MPSGVSTSPTLLIPVVVGGRDVLAVVDTAAQVSVVSTDFAVKCTPPLKQAGTVLLRGVDRSRIEGYSARDVTFCFGPCSLVWDVVVWDVILGLDFLLYHDAVISLNSYTITLNDHIVSAAVV